jgi:iron complex transport system substrate-binding protein
MFHKNSRTAAALALLASLAGCRAQTPTGVVPAAVAPNASSGVSPAPARRAAMPADDLTRPVGLRKPAQRVIVIGPGAVETIFALGGGSKIVGRDSAADVPAQIKSVPVVADYKGPSFEAAIAQRPDLVIAQGETWDRERIDAWQKKLGVPVAALTPTKMESVQKNADKMAAWLGLAPKEIFSRDLATPLRSMSDEALSAFIEVSRSPLWTAGENTLLDDLLRLSGWNNSGGSVAGYKQFSRESLLARQPDAYVVTGDPARKASILAELRRDPALKALRAIQEGQVIVLPSDHILRPGPRLQNGVAALRKAREELLAMRHASTAPRASTKYLHPDTILGRNL